VRGVEDRGAARRPFFDHHAGRLALATALLAALLRLIGLGSDWLNPDEGIHASIAALPSFAEIAAELPDHTDPPAFFVPLRLVARYSSEPALLRLPSLCFGVVAVFGVYLVARRAFAAATGVLAAALLALAPGEIVLSQLVRQYTLQHALLAFALWALLGFLEARRRADLALYALLLGLALLTHYGTALFLAAVALWLVGLAAAGRIERSCWRPLALAHLPLLALLGALYALHFRVHLSGAAPSAETRAFVSAFLPSTPAGLWSAFVGLGRYLFGARWGGAATILLGLGLVAGLRGRGRRFAALALVALCVAAALSASGRYPFGETRHASWLFVILVPIVAEGVRFALAGPGAGRWLGAACLLGLALAPALADRALGVAGVPSSGQLEAERLAGRDEVLALGESLRSLRDRGALVLTDRQTYAFLYPFFRDARRRSPAAADLPYREFAWGPSELVVARAWALRAGARSPDASDHVVGLWRSVRESRPAAEASELWLVLGGWPPLPFQRLGGLAADPADLDAARLPRGRRVAGLVRLDPARLAAEARVPLVRPGTASRPAAGSP
jgi:hypothetical protein